jgi:hypothetical protein
MITAREQNQLKRLFQSPEWRLVEQIATDLVAKWRSDNVVKDSEWETLKTALLNEGQARGVKLLLQEILEQAQDKENGN